MVYNFSLLLSYNFCLLHFGAAKQGSYLKHRMRSRGKNATEKYLWKIWSLIYLESDKFSRAVTHRKKQTNKTIGFLWPTDSMQRKKDRKEGRVCLRWKLVILERISTRCKAGKRFHWAGQIHSEFKGEQSLRAFGDKY